MKKSKLIKEMTLDEFKEKYKGEVVLENRKHHFNERGEMIPYEQTGEFVTDSQGTKHWVSYEGCYSKIFWDTMMLVPIVLKQIEFSEQQGFKHRTIALALHKEPTTEEVEEFMAQYPHMFADHYEARRLLVLRKYSYLDKFLTREGHQTYLIRCDVPHLYVGRRKFYTVDDYFEVRKSETKEMILIHY